MAGYGAVCAYIAAVKTAETKARSEAVFVCMEFSGVREVASKGIVAGKQKAH
jgi:hypothetical protein